MFIVPKKALKPYTTDMDPRITLILSIASTGTLHLLRGNELYQSFFWLIPLINMVIELNAPVENKLLTPKLSDLNQM